MERQKILTFVLNWKCWPLHTWESWRHGTAPSVTFKIAKHKNTVCRGEMVNSY